MAKSSAAENIPPH